MFLYLLITVFVIILIWFQVKWRRVRNFWAERGVPHQPPHPIYGSLTFLQRENPSVWMRQIYKDFKSPYVGIWAFWRPGLVINNPDLARNILVKDHDVFRNRFLSSGKTDPIGALNLFTVNDPTWSYLRRQLTVLFTASKLRSLHNLIKEKSGHLVQRIQHENGRNNVPDLRLLCVDYTTDVIGEAAFGVKSEATLNGDGIMRGITREFMEFDFYRGLSWASIFFFPELVDIFRFKFFPTKSMGTLKEIFRTIVEQRGGYNVTGKESKDLLDALVNIKQKALLENKVITEDVMLAQAAVFLLGGFDTTGITLTWTMYELAWSPHCQVKLYEELSKAKEDMGGKDFDATTLAELTYLNCVINETLRKYPTMGWLDRISSKNYKINDNLTIPPGTVVYVNAAAIQMDPDYFPNPLIYDPDRFLPENERNIKPYTFLPFGEGPRSCIGKRFAFQSLRYALSTIVLNYELRAIPNSTKPDECHFEKKSLFLGPGQKLSVQFIPRK